MAASRRGDALLRFYVSDGSRIMEPDELARALAKASTPEGRIDMLLESMVFPWDPTRPPTRKRAIPNQPMILPRMASPTFEPPTHLIGQTLGIIS